MQTGKRDERIGRADASDSEARDAQSTAGSWLVGYGDGSGQEYIVNVETGDPIATIRWGCGCCKDDRPLTTEEVKRARLIAAAPDLLEACKQAEKWLAGWASAEPYIGVIRDAIAKATQPSASRGDSESNPSRRQT